MSFKLKVFVSSDFSEIRELSVFSSQGGGLVETGGGSSKNNSLKRRDQEKIIVIERGIKHFCSTASKKKSNGYV